MSFPSPKLDIFVQHLQGSLHDFASTVAKSTREKAIQKEALQHLNKLKQMSSQALDVSKVRPLVESGDYQWLISFIHDMPKGEGSSKDRGVGLQGEKLLQEIEDFSQLCLQKSEVESKGIENLLDQSWALNEFKRILELGDKEATRTLVNLVKAGNSTAMEVLIEFASHNKVFLKELVTLQESSLFERALAKILLTSSDAGSGERLFQCMETISKLLKKTNNVGIYTILIDVLKANPSSQIIQLVTDLIIDKFDRPLLTQLVLESIQSNELWTAHFIQSYTALFSSPKAILKHHFFKELISLLPKDESLHLFLISCSFVCEKGSVFGTALSEAIKKLDPSSKIMRMHQVLLKGASKHERELLAAERFSFSSSPFPWSKLPLNYKFQVMQALLTRVKNLFLFVHGELDVDSFKDPLQSEHFNRPRCALLGVAKRTFPIAKELADLFSDSGFPLVCMLGDDEEDRPQTLQMQSLSNSRVTKSPLKPGIWVRDPFFYHEKSIRLPAFFELTDEMCLEAEFKHSQRTQLKPAFRIMGAVTSTQVQLKAMDHLIQCMDTGTLPKKKIQFNFLYNEGGNVLRGSSYGKSYLVVGKDVLGLNLRILQRELYELGLHIHEDGRVEYRDNPPLEELSVMRGIEEEEEEFRVKSRALEGKFSHISEELLLRLLAFDAGVDDVYPVEQCEYHLDVSAHIVDPENKVVLLNDSEAAFKLSYRMAEQELEKEAADEKRHAPEVGKAKKDTLDDQSMETSADIPPSEEKAKLAILAEKKKAMEERSREYQTLMMRVAEHEKLTERDLRAHGFNVVRAPGCFYEFNKENPMLNQANFFNFITYMNHKEEPSVLALGCSEEYQKLFLKYAAKYMPTVQSENIYFAPEKTSKRLLKEGGGLHCILQML